MNIQDLKTLQNLTKLVSEFVDKTELNMDVEVSPEWVDVSDEHKIYGNAGNSTISCITGAIDGATIDFTIYCEDNENPATVGFDRLYVNLENTEGEYESIGEYGDDAVAKMKARANK